MIKNGHVIKNIERDLIKKSINKHMFVGGFTLEELLLTLGIIGLVVLLAMPNLLQRTHDNALVSSFLKTESILANGLKQAEVINETKVYKIVTLEEFKTFFESQLQTTESCESDVCLLNGSMFNYGDTFYSGCTHSAEGSASALKDSCIKLEVDVNGTKGPNKPGKDIYNLWVTVTGLIPEGQLDYCSNGSDCGAFVLTYHRLFDCEPGYKASESGCVARFPDAQYIEDLNKYVLNLGNSNSYTEALAACSGFDMHLAGIGELESLYESGSELGISSGTFWSSSSYNRDNVYVLNFSSGARTTASKNESYYGLCVASQ